MRRTQVRVLPRAFTRKLLSAVVTPTLKQMAGETTLIRTMTSSTPFYNMNSVTKRAFRLNIDTEITKEATPS